MIVISHLVRVILIFTTAVDITIFYQSACQKVFVIVKIVNLVGNNNKNSLFFSFCLQLSFEITTVNKLIKKLDRNVSGRNHSLQWLLNSDRVMM